MPQQDTSGTGTVDTGYQARLARAASLVSKVFRIDADNWRVLSQSRAAKTAGVSGWIVTAIVPEQVFECTCPDYQGRELLGNDEAKIARTWGGPEEGFYPCKHIIAVAMKEQYDYMAIIINELRGSLSIIVGRWSTRDLDGLTNAWRIRRDSDNAEIDIGYSGGFVDETAIASFCGFANGFLRTWYGKDNENLEQATPANQPKIYDPLTGVTKDLSQNIAADFSGAFMVSPGVVLGSQPISAYIVGNFTLTNASVEQFILDGDDSGVRLGFKYGGGNYTYFSQNEVSGASNDLAGIPKTLAIQFSEGTSVLRRNKVALFSGDPGDNGVDGIVVGADFNQANPTADFGLTELVLAFTFIDGDPNNPNTGAGIENELTEEFTNKDITIPPGGIGGTCQPLFVSYRIDYDDASSEIVTLDRWGPVTGTTFSCAIGACTAFSFDRGPYNGGLDPCDPSVGQKFLVPRPAPPNMVAVTVVNAQPV